MSSHQEPNAFQDPGWGPALRRGLIPFPFLIRDILGRGDRTDSITTLRSLYLNFLQALLLLLLLEWLIRSLDEAKPARPISVWVVVALGLLGLGSIGAMLWVRRRPLVMENTALLAASYIWDMSLGIAIAGIPALAGFGLMFVGDQPWYYLIGLVFALIGLGLAAPTRSNLDRREREILAAGSTLSLKEAVRTALPMGREGRQLAREVRRRRRR